MNFKFLIVAAASGGLFVLYPAQAYTWNISPPIPQQCATTSVAVSNDSVLPLDLLLIPYGPLPLSDASKTIYEIPFNGSNPYKIDFQMKYPAGTQFIFLVNAILLHDLDSDQPAIFPASCVLSYLILKFSTLSGSHFFVEIYAIPVTQSIFEGPTQIRFPLLFVIISFLANLSHLSGLQVADAAKGWSGVKGYNQGITVAQNPNNDSSCWDSPTPKPPFTFSIYPNRLAQCEQTRIYWKADEVRG